MVYVLSEIVHIRSLQLFGNGKFGCTWFALAIRVVLYHMSDTKTKFHLTDNQCSHFVLVALKLVTTVEVLFLPIEHL